MAEIVQVYITFGVQYGRDPERSEIHPLGMIGTGYAVVEAPNYDTARRIAFDVFGQQFAFDYSEERWVEGHKADIWYPDGELMRVEWPEGRDRLWAIYGRPLTPALKEDGVKAGEYVDGVKVRA